MKAIIFDFGQVFVSFDPDHMTAPYTDSAAERKRIREVAFDRFYWDKLDRGDITEEAMKADFARRLAPGEAQKAALVLDNWMKHIPMRPGMLALAKELKQKYRLYLLSNICVHFAQNYQNYPPIKELFDLFDGLVFSGPLHLAKPEKAIFDHLLTTYGLNAADCLFVDDNPANTAAAERYGIRSCTFGGDPQQVRDMLKQCEVLKK